MNKQNAESLPVSLDSVVIVAGNHYAADLGGEVAILDYTSGIYYGLGNVSARIWELLEQPSKVQQILDTLLAEYDVEPLRCEQDLLDFLVKLYTKGLIKLV